MATILGTNGIDNLKGGFASDFILAMNGADLARGGYGNDQISGGEGDDKLYGDENNDYLMGDVGDDQLFGGNGSDTLIGGAGADTMSGGNGDDNFIISGRAESIGDFVIGGSGVDTLTLTMTDGTGIRFTAADPLRTVEFESIFRIKGIERYVFNGGTGNDYFVGYLLDDVLSGGKGNDVLKGSGGDDFLMGGDGNDSLDGGNDDDTLMGGEGRDRLAGGNGRDFLLGDAGDDTLFGDAGDDSLAGGRGLDVIEGGDGNDVLYSDEFGDDRFVDKDRLYGGNGDDYVTIGRTDTGNGGAGTDHLTLALSTSTVAENFVFSDANITLASGGAFVGFEALDFRGGSANDTVTAGALADTLAGGGGNDTLRGGGGTDYLIDDAGADKLYGDAGDDFFQHSGRHGFADYFNGGGGNDILSFNQEDGNPDISAYVDLLDQTKNSGMAQKDTFVSIETFIGSQMDDVLLGDGTANRFYGGDSDDILDGRDGDDYLSGGDGADTLTGGAGKDTFDLSGFAQTEYDNEVLLLADFEPLDPPGFEDYTHVWQDDVITDFVRGQDKIAIDSVGFGFGTSGAGFAIVAGTDPTATSSAPVLLFNTTTKQLFWDGDGNGTAKDPLLVGTVLGAATLNASDFTFI